MQSFLANPEVTDETPCTGHCTTALGDDVCRSCHRTFDEITRWVEMSAEERCAVNLRIAILQSTGFPLGQDPVRPELVEGRE